MKMMMFLLISAVALLVNPAVVKPHHKPEYNLNHMSDLVKKYMNESVAKKLFVENVSHLAEGSGKCEDKFFCKVQQILHKSKIEDVKDIVRNLKVFIDGQNYNCKEVLKEVKSTGISIQIPEFLGHLNTCIQHRNFIRENTSHS